MAHKDLTNLVGQDLGPSAWHQITQTEVNLFADATHDHQFIHVDEEMAKATPFGGTIAHGFLSLSLIPYLVPEDAIAPDNLVMALNYGLNKVRFLQPVLVGSKVRSHTKVLEVLEKKPGHFLVACEVTVEIEGEAKPALIAETLIMYIIQ